MSRFTPAISRRARLTLAGATWSAVGVMLLTWATGWLEPVDLLPALGLAALGIAAGFSAWRALFSRLARTNIARLVARPARACAFGFIAPKGWLITATMIALGATLRHSAVPKPWLAVVYSAIGSALLLASLNYYVHLARTNPE